MKNVKRKCSRCGNNGLHMKKRPATRTVAGHSFKASVPALVCDACGAVYFDGPSLGDFDLAVANKLAHAGVSDGEAIKFMRKAVGLPAVTLAQLLDTSLSHGQSGFRHPGWDRHRKGRQSIRHARAPPRPTPSGSPWSAGSDRRLNRAGFPNG